MKDNKKSELGATIDSLINDFWGPDGSGLNIGSPKKQETGRSPYGSYRDPIEDFREIDRMMNDLKRNMDRDPAMNTPESPFTPAKGAEQTGEKPEEKAPETAAATAENEEPSETPKEPETDPREDLEALVGLTDLKKDVDELINLVKTQKLREEKGMKVVPVSKHLVFTGNPGTGKTTVARILARLYKQVGVLSKGQLVEVDRSNLVAGYVGQTAMKTQEKITEAMGGVLFIDEAYTLANGNENDFGQESIDTILKAMEDHRDDFVVIVAGYPDLMKKFINSNPGLKSRFNKYFFFPDYSAEELIRIFDSQCARYEYQLAEDARTAVEEHLKVLEQEKDENFANARDVRNFFETLITRQATRIALMEGEPTKEDMALITTEDVTAAVEQQKKTGGNREEDDD